MNFTMSKVMDGRKPPEPQYIACELCNGENPLNIAMISGITNDRVDSAREIIINNVPEEHKEKFINQIKTIDDMGPQITIPQQLVIMFGLNNEVVTNLMKLTMALEELTDLTKNNMYNNMRSHYYGIDLDNDVSKSVENELQNTETDVCADNEITDQDESCVEVVAEI